MAGIKVDILEKSAGVFVVTLAGPLDAETHQHFDYLLEKLLVSSTRAIALDMEGVDYISSMGISSLFNLRKAGQANDFELTMANLQPRIKKVLETVRAIPQEAVFDSAEELEKYLQALQKTPEKTS